MRAVDSCFGRWSLFSKHYLFPLDFPTHNGVSSRNCRAGRCPSPFCSVSVSYTELSVVFCVSTVPGTTCSQAAFPWCQMQVMKLRINFSPRNSTEDAYLWVTAPSTGYWVSEFKYRGYQATLTEQLKDSFPWETSHDTPVLQGRLFILVLTVPTCTSIRKPLTFHCTSYFHVSPTRLWTQG